MRDAAVDGFLVYSAPWNDLRVEAASPAASPSSRSTSRATRHAVRRHRRPRRRAHRRRASPRARPRTRCRARVHHGARREGRLQLDLSVERLAGYEDGPRRVLEARSSSAPAARTRSSRHARQTLALLREPDPPTAILAMSDILALGALEAARARRRCPGSCRSSASTTARPPSTIPPLTTITQPQEEKGRLAAQWLMEEIEDERPPGWHTRAILPPSSWSASRPRPRT